MAMIFYLKLFTDLVALGRVWTLYTIYNNHNNNLYLHNNHYYEGKDKCEKSEILKAVESLGNTQQSLLKSMDGY